jgi:hypothetical protein
MTLTNGLPLPLFDSTRILAIAAPERIAAP